MDKSTALSALSSTSKVRYLLRSHLSGDFSHVHGPIFLHQPDVEDDDDSDDDETDSDSGCETDKTDKCLFRMSAMVPIIDIIDGALRCDPLNKFGQIDIMFLPDSTAPINADYLDSLGFTYMVGSANGKLHRILKRFNQNIKCDGNGRCRRCVILIIGVNGSATSTATVLVYQPLQHSSVPREIADCCEFGYICNMRSEFLPGRTIQNSNALCLSVHIHRDTSHGRVERVYLTDGTRNVRVFKCSLQNTLIHFGVERNLEGIAWDKNREFGDPLFDQFVESLFPGLN